MLQNYKILLVLLLSITPKYNWSQHTHNKMQIHSQRRLAIKLGVILSCKRANKLSTINSIPTRLIQQYITNSINN